MPASAVGAGLILLAGVLMGAFTLPMKFARQWPWEATWLVYSVSGLFMFPLAVAIATLPPLPSIYLHSSQRALWLAATLGFGWGIGSVLFGIGVSRLGMSLGFSIILGLTAALGSLIPMLALAPGQIFTLKGLLILAGLAIVIGGIYVCGVASGIRDRGAGASDRSAARTGLSAGIVICLLSGILASMLNLAMAFGEDIARQAVNLGASALNASNAIWVLAVAFGAIANAGYCIWLLIRNRTASALGKPGTLGHWVLGALMGALWFGGVTVYGSAATALGSWGAILGWPCLMALMIVTANVLGWLTGEWRGAPPRARRTMLAGVAVLGAGVLVIGYSGIVSP